MSDIFELRRESMDKEENHARRPNDPYWVPVNSDGKQRALIRCNCGELIGIPLHHIHFDGAVTASLLHEPGCGWHIFAKLLDWKGGDSPPLEKS